MFEQFAFLVLSGAGVLGLWHALPKCPECGFPVSVPDRIDPSIRQCRRCLSIFRDGGPR